MAASMDIPLSNEASERDSLTSEIVEGLPFLSTVQLQGVLSIIRARRNNATSIEGDMNA